MAAKYKVCAACGLEHTLGALHHEVCPAYTCDYCSTNFKHVLELDEHGSRICEDCAAEEIVNGN